MTRETNPLRVLLLENESADAELILHAVRQFDKAALVSIAPTRREFTELLARHEYDLILADYRLHDWTGMEALREVRRLGFEVPLIIVTGTLGDELAVECVKAGAADYVLKGNLTRLSIAATRAIEEKRARDESRRAQQLAAQAQLEVQERDERFRELADNIEEVFFVLDARHKTTLYVNPAYERIWGRTRESLYLDPRTFAETVPPGDRERLLEYMGRIERGEQPGKIEYRVVQPSGAVRWLLTHAVPIRNEQGEVYRISGVALDVTESRQTQAALEESVERFRKLAQASFDAIVITVDGIAREVNRGYVEMFGYDNPEEIVGRPLTEFIAEESRTELGRRLTDDVEGTYEMVGKRKDGRKIMLEVTAAMHSIGGKPARLTAIRDITDKRVLENQFRQAQKMEAVGRLAGGVAHDFNNLLTVIMSYTDMLLEEVPANDTRAEDLGQIRKAATTAASLTRQLLAFSRQQVIEPRLIDLNAIVSTSGTMLKRLIGEDIQLATSLTKDAVTVMIDPGQLEQVIMNLAVNARDAMPNGGRLTLETTSVEVDAGYARDHWPVKPGQFAMLAVTDTGTGMDEETRARIFEPFFTTKEVGKGTGLGLATAYGTIKQSNGFIWVYSEPGHGTTFKIYLPLVAEKSGEYEAHREAPSVPMGSETVLLAEDAAAVRAAARQILERYGYTVLEAPSGKDALSIASKRHGPIDLLLTDVVMPEMSGRELAEQFLQVRPETKVLFMSGYADDAVVRHGMLSPGTAYLQKPFTPESLARKVHDVLKKKPTP